MFRFVLCCALAALLFPAVVHADTLTFTNGDQLTGTLDHANAAACVFHSDMAGSVTVPWKNIRDLRTTTSYVVISSDGGTPQRGELIVAAGMIEITSSTAPQPGFVTPAAIRMIVSPKVYASVVEAHPSPWQTWHGQVTGGFSQVSATQSSSSYTAGMDFERPVPQLGWMNQRSNTLFHFHGTYGKVAQRGRPTLVTSIYTSSLEQDQDLSQRLFVFGNGHLDHNLSQGLELQQSYGAGLGWKLFDSAPTKLSLKADLHWTHQRFLSAAAPSFLASSFSESLRQSYGKLIWTQSVSLTPSYTNGLAYQMSGMSAWAVPLYHALSLNFTVIDSYLNNPQPGFMRNSLQVSTGLQYTLR
ncbi:MAG TPA: DUF481 domain-containing protein [Terriglobales bacterium]|jgi:hypothetical protein